jgi:hypothetical protein
MSQRLGARKRRELEQRKADERLVNIVRAKFPATSTLAEARERFDVVVQRLADEYDRTRRVALALASRAGVVVVAAPRDPPE